MTKTIWPEEMVLAFSPDFVAPVIGYLTSEASSTTQGLFEISGGWVAAVRWQRTQGYSVRSIIILCHYQAKLKDHFA
jgi:multifunctional beta-oxidation protein